MLACPRADGLTPVPGYGPAAHGGTKAGGLE